MKHISDTHLFFWFYEYINSAIPIICWVCQFSSYKIYVIACLIWCLYVTPFGSNLTIVPDITRNEIIWMFLFVYKKNRLLFDWMEIRTMNDRTYQLFKKTRGRNTKSCSEGLWSSLIYRRIFDVNQQSKNCPLYKRRFTMNWMWCAMQCNEQYTHTNTHTDILNIA